MNNEIYRIQAEIEEKELEIQKKRLEFERRQVIINTATNYFVQQVNAPIRELISDIKGKANERI